MCRRLSSSRVEANGRPWLVFQIDLGVDAHVAGTGVERVVLADRDVANRHERQQRDRPGDLSRSVRRDGAPSRPAGTAGLIKRGHESARHERFGMRETAGRGTAPDYRPPSTQGRSQCNCRHPTR